MLTPCSGLPRYSSGMRRPGSRSSSSTKMPSRVIFALTLRSAEHDTPIPTGHEAPCRGRRMTRTSWAKYFPPNWAPIPSLYASSSSLLLQLQIAERLAVLVPLGGKLVVILGGGELDRLQAGVGTGTADDDGDVIRRTRGGAEVLHLADQELQKAFRGQQRLRLLEKGGLVGRAAALRHEEELVGVAVHRLDVDLGRQIRAAVDLAVHVERHGLGVPEIFFRIGLVHALGERFLILPSRPDVLPFLGDDGRRAGVLAHREFESGGNFRVAQERHRHALVVLRCLRVAQDPAHGFVVLPAQQEGDLAHRLIGERRSALQDPP